MGTRPDSNRRGRKFLAGLAIRFDFDFDLFAVVAIFRTLA